MNAEILSQALAVVFLSFVVASIFSLGSDSLSGMVASSDNTMDSCDRAQTQLKAFKCRMNEIRERTDKGAILYQALLFKGTDDWLTAKDYVILSAQKGAFTANELAEEGVLEAFTAVLGDLDMLNSNDPIDLKEALQQRFGLKSIDLQDADALRFQNGMLINRGLQLQIGQFPGAEIIAMPHGGFRIVGSSFLSQLNKP